MMTIQHVHAIACRNELSQMFFLCGKPELNMPVAQYRTPAQIVLHIHVQYRQEWTALSPSKSTAEELGRPHMHHRLMNQTRHKL